MNEQPTPGSPSEVSKNWLDEVVRPVLESETSAIDAEREVSDIEPEACGTGLEEGVGCKAVINETDKVASQIGVIISWRNEDMRRVRISVDATLRGLPGNDVSPPLGSINTVSVEELPTEDTKNWLQGEVQRIVQRLQSS